MKKIVFLFVTLLTFAFAITAKAELTADGLNGKQVFIKCNEANKYVYAAANDLTLNAKSGVLLPMDAVFKFEKCDDCADPSGGTYLGTYKIYSEKQQKYVKQVNSAQYVDAESATQWHVFTVDGLDNGVFITTNANVTAQNCWNNYQGTGNKIGSWSNNDGSKMIVEFAPTNLDDVITTLETTYNEKNTATQGHENDIFYPTQTKLQAMQTTINALKTASSSEGYEALYNTYTTSGAATAATFLPTDYNLPTVGTKYYISCAYNRGQGVDSRMGATAGRGIKHYAPTQAASRNIWVFENGETEGDYYIKNELTGEYIQGVSNSTAKIASGKVAYNILPVAGGKFGYCGLKTKATTGLYGGLHLNGSGVVVGWTPDGEASQWKLTEVTDEDAATAAETALTDTEANSQENIIIAEQLGVELSRSSTLKDYIDGAKYTLYEKASDNVYRIKMAGPSGLAGRVLGTYTITSTNNASRANELIPLAVVNPDADMDDNKSKSPEVLWQLKKVPGEESFKIVHYNISATSDGAVCAVGEVQNGASWANAAGFKTFADGCKYNLAVKDASQKTLRFTSGGKTINFDGNASCTGILDQWDGNNASVVLQKIEEVDIPLTQIEASNGSFATVCLPFDIESVSGASAAYLTTIDETRTTVAASEFPGGIPAKQGAILIGANKADAVAKLMIGKATALGATNLLEGITTKLTALDENKTYFTLSRNGSGEVGMRKFTNSKDTGIGANKAFITQDTGASSISFLSFLLGDDDLTAVDAVETTTKATSGIIYDLQGRIVTNPTKGGLYIQNGKKIVF